MCSLRFLLTKLSHAALLCISYLHILLPGNIPSWVLKLCRQIRCLLKYISFSLPNSSENIMFSSSENIMCIIHSSDKLKNGYPWPLDIDKNWMIWQIRQLLQEVSNSAHFEPSIKRQTPLAWETSSNVGLCATLIFSDISTWLSQMINLKETFYISFDGSPLHCQYHACTT